MPIYQPKSKYAIQIYNDGNLFADLTGICSNRKLSIIRNDADQITFDIAMDKITALAKSLNIKVNDILQSWSSEIRLVRYGTVLSAAELQPWSANVGGDRMIKITAKGWLELMKWRRTSDEYLNKSAIVVAQSLFNTTLARTYGSSGNYNGLVIGASPAVDGSNIYDDMLYNSKTIYDALRDLTKDNNGPDLEFTWDKKFNLFWPSIGVTRSDIVFTYPHGNVKDIQYSVDPSNSFNSLLGRGKGNGYSQITNQVDDIPSQQKYGLREGVKDYSNITSTDQLTNFTISDLNIYKTPLVLHKIIFDGSGKTSAPAVGSFHIGDRILVSVTNFQLYQDINQYYRIDQIDVAIGDNDEEDVTLSLSLPGA